jgi:hypothetical protein
MVAVEVAGPPVLIIATGLTATGLTAIERALGRTVIVIMHASKTYASRSLYIIVEVSSRLPLKKTKYLFALERPVQGKQRRFCKQQSLTHHL